MDNTIYRNANFNLAVNQYSVNKPISAFVEGSQEEQNDQIIYLPQSI